MISPDEFRRFKYFAGTSEQMLIILSRFSTIRQFKAGERILEEGAPANYLMIVKSGEVDIIYLLGDNREAVAESAIRGDVIAWSSILPPYQLTASAVARKDGELIAIEAEKLRDTCHADALLGCQLMTEIAQGLRDRLQGLRVQIAARAHDLEPTP